MFWEVCYLRGGGGGGRGGGCTAGGQLVVGTGEDILYFSEPESYTWRD